MITRKRTTKQLEQHWFSKYKRTFVMVIINQNFGLHQTVNKIRIVNMEGDTNKKTSPKCNLTKKLVRKY